MRVLVSALLLATAAVLTWLVNDTERLRHTIEDVVSTVADRPFIIDGEFDFDLGRITRLRADGIRWRESASDTSPDMLQVQGFSGSFNLFSLLRGSIEIIEVEADQVVLRLAWDDGGGFNWPLGHQAGTATPTAIQLLVHQARVHNFHIHVLHPSLSEDLQIVLREARKQRDESGRFEVAASALLEGRQLEIDGHLGPFPASADARVDFALAVQGPLATLSAEGAFNWRGQPRDMGLKARLTAPNAMDLAQRLKLPLQTSGGVRLNAELNREGDGIRGVANGNFGEYELNARFRSDDLKSLLGLDVALRSSGPSIHDLAIIADLPGMPDAPYEFEARVRQTEQGVDLESFRLDSTGLQLKGSGFLRVVDDRRDIDLRFDAEGANFAAVARLFGLHIAAEHPFNLQAVVEGNGPESADAVDAKLQLGSSSASVSGSISDSGDLVGSLFQFDIKAPDATQLAGIAGIRLPRGSNLKIRGSASVLADKIRFEDLAVSLDEAELSGAAWLERNAAQPGLGFEGGLKGPNLSRDVGPLLPDRVGPFLPQHGFAADAVLNLAAGVLDIRTANVSVGNSRLAFSGRADLRKPGPDLTGDLTIHGDSLSELFGELWAGGLPDTDFELKSGLHMSSGAIRFSGLGFTGKQVRIGGELGFTGEGYSRAEFDLSVAGDRLADLWPATKAYRPAAVPFEMAVTGSGDQALLAVERLRARLGEIRLELSGELQLQPSLAARAVRLQGSGPRLSELGSIGPWEFTDSPFKISATLQGGALEQTVENLRFVSGRNDLSGRFRYALGGDVPSFDIALNSTYLNLDEIRVPNPGTEESITTATGRDRLFSDDPLPFEVLDGFNGQLSLGVDSLVSQQRQWRNLAAEASLEQGVLKVERAQVDAARGKLKLSGLVQPMSTGRSVTAEVRASHAMIALEDMSVEELDQLPQHVIAARLSASGNTTRELAASLDGYAWVMGGAGRVRRAELGPLAGDFLIELFAAVSPLSKKNPYAQVDCQGVYLEISDGRIETAPAFVAQTENAVIMAIGTVDLVSEEIDFIFETTPRKGIGVSLGSYTSPFTKIAGTLKDPRIVLNPKGALVEGGAAVATVGISVLLKGLVKRWLGSRRICEEVAEEAAKIRSERDPAAVPDLEQLMAGTYKPGTAPQRELETPGRTEQPQSILDEM